MEKPYHIESGAFSLRFGSIPLGGIKARVCRIKNQDYLAHFRHEFSPSELQLIMRQSDLVFFDHIDYESDFIQQLNTAGILYTPPQSVKANPSLRLDIHEVKAPRKAHSQISLSQEPGIRIYTGEEQEKAPQRAGMRRSSLLKPECTQQLIPYANSLNITLEKENLLASDMYLLIDSWGNAVVTEIRVAPDLIQANVDQELFTLLLKHADELGIKRLDLANFAPAVQQQYVNYHHPAYCGILGMQSTRFGRLLKLQMQLERCYRYLLPEQTLSLAR